MRQKTDVKFIGEKIVLKFCNNLKELITEIINYKQREMTSLNDEETTIYESQKVCHICKEKFCYDENKKKKNLNCTKKSEIIATTQENLEELLIVFAI